jgi:hypothetical protein
MIIFVASFGTYAEIFGLNGVGLEELLEVFAGESNHIGTHLKVGNHISSFSSQVEAEKDIFPCPTGQAVFAFAANQNIIAIASQDLIITGLAIIF